VCSRDARVMQRWGDSPAQVAMTPELSDLVSNFSHETTCRHIVARDGVNATTKVSRSLSHSCAEYSRARLNRSLSASASSMEARYRFYAWHASEAIHRS